MKFHLVANDDHQRFLDDLTEAANNPPENHFFQEVQFNTIQDAHRNYQLIWSALISFGEIPTSL